jgi:type II secretory pathway pseudopilin PulG
MSQQINLLLSELRPKFDWLGLPVVLAAALAGLLLLAGLAQMQLMQLDRIKLEAASVGAQSAGLQQQLVSLGQSLGQRKADANLPEKISVEKTGIADRKEVMTFIGIGQPTRVPEYSKVLKGLAEQRVEGVWLTGFRLVPSAIELRGRLLDPALLPVYINRLNADTVFFGRRFSALEMKGVDPAAEKSLDSKLETKPVVGRRYTEFVLHTDSIPAEKTP